MAARELFKPQLLEYVCYRQPIIHAWPPAKIVGLDPAIRQVVSNSGFGVRPKMFAFAGDMKIQGRRRCTGCGAQRRLRSPKWGPARWTSCMEQTDLFAALVACRKRFPDRYFLAIVSCWPIQLHLTARDGNTKPFQRIGFETDVAGLLNDVVHTLTGLPTIPLAT
jgi:hypothetical protein